MKNLRFIIAYSIINIACAEFNIYSMIINSKQINKADEEKNIMGIHPRLALHTAVYNNNLEQVKKLLESYTLKSYELKDENYFNQKINELSFQGLTALAVACRLGHQEIAKYLISQKANVYEAVHTLNTPIVEATSKGHTEIVQDLIEARADVNTSWSRTYGSPTFILLISAVKNNYVDIVKLLINNGANVNQELADGSSAMHYAAANGNLEIIKDLMAAQARFNNPINRSLPFSAAPLDLAFEKGHERVAKELIYHGAYCNRFGGMADSKLTEFEKQCKQMQLKFLEAINNLDYEVLNDSNNNFNLELKDDKGNTPLAQSIIKYDIKKILWLLAKRVNLNAKNYDGSNILDIAQEYCRNYKSHILFPDESHWYPYYDQKTVDEQKNLKLRFDLYNFLVWYHHKVSCNEQDEILNAINSLNTELLKDLLVNSNIHILLIDEAGSTLIHKLICRYADLRQQPEMLTKFNEVLLIIFQKYPDAILFEDSFGNSILNLAVAGYPEVLDVILKIAYQEFRKKCRTQKRK